jgi:hypothetical protein
MHRIKDHRHDRNIRQGFSAAAAVGRILSAKPLLLALTAMSLQSFDSEKRPRSLRRNDYRGSGKQCNMFSSRRNGGSWQEKADVPSAAKQALHRCAEDHKRSSTPKFRHFSIQKKGALPRRGRSLLPHHTRKTGDSVCPGGTFLSAGCAALSCGRQQCLPQLGKKCGRGRPVLPPTAIRRLSQPADSPAECSGRSDWSARARSTASGDCRASDEKSRSSDCRVSITCT